MPGSSIETLRLKQFAFAAKFLKLRIELSFDFIAGGRHAILWQHVMLGGVDVHVIHLSDDIARQRINHRQFFDVVAPQFNSESRFFVGRPDFNHIATNSEVTTLRGHVVARVMNVAKFPQQFITIDDPADLQRDHHFEVILRRTESVDTTDAGDDDHIASADQGTGRQ